MTELYIKRHKIFGMYVRKSCIISSSHFRETQRRLCAKMRRKIKKNKFKINKMIFTDLIVKKLYLRDT
jgi:hypothetical protein